MNFLQLLADYLRQPEILAAVVLPAGLSILGIVMHSKSINLRLVQFWALALLLTAATGRWEETAEMRQLMLTPWALAIFGVAHFYRISYPKLLVFAASFLACLPVDIGHALYKGWTNGEPLLYAWMGVGGAGWGDGLLLDPCLTVAVLYYVEWRQGRLSRATLFGVKSPQH